MLDKFLFADDMAKGAPTEVTSAWKALQGAHRYTERSKIASGKQVHLPWKHIIKSRAH